jgi:serine/threonine protein kinase
MRLEIGTSLGPYEIIGLLGTGGMGEVYRARDRRLGREVAVKVLPASYSQDSERLRRFEQEARSAGMLNHPNILAIYDVGTHEGCAYIVSELLEGATLRQRQGGSPLPPRKATDYALQIAHGLAAAHEKKIVHRDLKPENLFITKDGRVKILDFGLAKLTQPADKDKTDITALPTETGPAVVMGTIGYMSPEQVRGQIADSRSDIFTFGSILYEMLSGKRAFQRETPVETMNAILKEDPPPFGDNHVPAALERIVQYCLEKNREERFQSAKDMALAIEAISHSSGSVAETVSVTVPYSRRRLAYLSAILASIVAASLLSFFAGKKTTEKALEGSLTSVPSYQRLTFRRGVIKNARFTPDGNTIVYSASWEGGPMELFSVRPGNPESRSLGITGAILCAISPQENIVFKLFPNYNLAQMPLGGGAPREIMEGVATADWSPDGKSLAVIRVGSNALEYPAGKILYRGEINLPPRVSPKGDLIAFCEWPEVGNKSIAVVDLNGKKTTLSSGYFSFGGVAWNPSGNEIWFRGTEAAGDSLYAVNLKGERRLLLRAAGWTIRDICDISKNGKLLITLGTWRNAISGLFPGDTRERDLSLLSFSSVSDLSDDGKTLLFTEEGESVPGSYSIYLRKTDGSDAVRLGEGRYPSLSPDGKSVLAISATAPSLLAILPTGPGEQKTLKNEKKYDYEYANWFPDGKRILFQATEPGHKTRIYVENLIQEKVKPIAPEGVILIAEGNSISPDGKLILASDSENTFLYPVEGGAPVPVQGLDPRDRVIRWAADSQSLYIYYREKGLNKIFRLRLKTADREPLREIAPSDRAGVTFVEPVLITPDGKSYVYSYFRELTSLYLVEGLK